MKIKKSFGENLFDVVNVVFLTILIVITIYPFLYVAMASISDPYKMVKHEGILLFPQGLSLSGYATVLKQAMIWTGYKNTLFYVLVGTALNIFMTSIGAYVLSRQGPRLIKPFMLMIIFTMYFNGGLIPNYLLVKGLNLIDNRMALILPSLIITWNLIIMRSSFEQIPESLVESARIDGGNDVHILFRIILPMSMPIISVMILFYGVMHWNAWFNASLYIRDRAKYPLQLVLREILIMNSTDAMLGQSGGGADMLPVDVILKYSTTMVATVPILCVYPFLQKYFTKGIMVGAVKG